MTEFEKYLGTWLLNSGEDCCSKCAHCPPLVGVDDVCNNLKRNGKFGDDICLQGIRMYYEEHKNDE